MINLDNLSRQFAGHIKFHKIGSETYQIKAPFFHQDGDMMDLFLKETDEGLMICDMGTSLMRLSYSFELDTDNKVKVFNRIVNSSGVSNENGNIVLPSTYDTFFDDLMTFQSAVIRVTNLDVLRREQVASLFFESFSTYMENNLSKEFHRIEHEYQPTGEDSFIADYAILDNPKRPVYILGIKDNIHAARAAALCNRLVSMNKPHTSVAVHQDPESLSKRDRNSLTNSVDKQFTSLEEFKTGSVAFITRSIAS